MASKTPFLDLYKKEPIVDKDDTFNITTMLNQNWDKIDDKTKALNEYIGSLSGLSTVDKLNLVSAINEIDNNITSHKAEYASLISGGQVFTAVLQNGWTGILEYSKNDLGMVHLRGNIKPDSTMGTVIATLPLGYRPKGLANHAFVHFKNYGDYKPQIGGYVVSEGSVVCKASDLIEGGAIFINTIFKVG